MSYISQEKLIQNIETYCNDGFDKNQYKDATDCIAKQRIEYGIDLTFNDKVALTISVASIIIAIASIIIAFMANKHKLT